MDIVKAIEAEQLKEDVENFSIGDTVKVLTRFDVLSVECRFVYDNALLLPLYAEGAARWNNPALKSAAEGISDWLERSMKQERGGYAASIDADAEEIASTIVFLCSDEASYITGTTVTPDGGFTLTI